MRTLYFCRDFYLSSIFFSSPIFSGRRLDVNHTLTHGAALLRNIECMSEMCCTWLAGNTGRKKSPSVHHRTTLSGYIFTIKACIDNRERMLNSNIPHMFLQYGELRPTNGWDLLTSLGHPSKFQRVLHLGSVTAWHSSSGRQPNFAALNRGRHLYSAGRPSRWALATF